MLSSSQGKGISTVLLPKAKTESFKASFNKSLLSLPSTSSAAALSRSHAAFLLALNRQAIVKM